MSFSSFELKCAEYNWHLSKKNQNTVCIISYNKMTVSQKIRATYEHMNDWIIKMSYLVALKWLSYKNKSYLQAQWLNYKDSQKLLKDIMSYKPSLKWSNDKLRATYEHSNDWMIKI